MPIKQVTYTYDGMNQDVLKDKTPFTFYFKGDNIRIADTGEQSLGGVVNEKGNSFVLNIPSPTIVTEGPNANNITYVANDVTNTLPFLTKEIQEQIDNGELAIQSLTQSILGYTVARDSIIILSTDGNGFDCVWKVYETGEFSYSIELLYVRNMNFSIDNPIQVLFNYENLKIQKIYWADGAEQLRFLNINHSIENEDIEELIDLNLNAINSVGDFRMSAIKVVDTFGGGTHTSGMIQYAYNLYRLNSSQTIISPVSELVAIDKGMGQGGGEVNEKLNIALSLEIEDLDDRYTHIKLYSIKYTSLNEIPKISLIEDSELTSWDNHKFIDDGRSLEEIGINEFLFLGSQLYIPKHIQSKDSRLFIANVEDRQFNFEIDTRAYSAQQGGLYLEVTDKDNIPTNIETTGVNAYFLPEKHDACNPHYGIHIYSENGIYGGTGKYITYHLIQVENLENADKYRFFKDDEIYRIGIQFYNRRGQVSQPSWIADFIAPNGNLEGKYNTLQVILKEDFYLYVATLPIEDRPIGYKILRAERTENDKTILTQGGLTSMMVQTGDHLSPDDVSYWSNLTNGDLHKETASESLTKIPSLLARAHGLSTFGIQPISHLKSFSVRYPEDIGLIHIGKPEIYNVNTDEYDYNVQYGWQHNKIFQMYSPNILFNMGNVSGNNLYYTIKGSVNWESSNSIRGWKKRYAIENLEVVGEDRFDGAMASTERAYLGPNNNDYNPEFEYDTTLFKLIYNPFLVFSKNTKTTNYLPILGIPEIAEKGQGPKNYNNNGKYGYTNSFKAVRADGYHYTGSGDNKEYPPITGLNSYNARNLTFVDKNEKSLDQIVVDNFLSDSLETTGIMLAEIRKPDDTVYIANIYGGRGYESKVATDYLEIGSYTPVNITNDNPSTIYVTDIYSPGDTYVHPFRFLRMGKADSEVFDLRKNQFAEIVEFPVETTINLLNRNDSSLADWDAKFQPRFDEYSSYNTVYSQKPTLIKRSNASYKFKEIKKFDIKIMATKTKIPGEFIDNWTDFLENEVMHLDGKYGPINAFINSNDRLYTLQDSAIANINIQPRVQTVADDGISIELGSGQVLHDYQYINTSSGTMNKWSTFTSPTGFYYVDIKNKFIGHVMGNQVKNISLLHGMNSFMQSNLNYDELKIDNPLLKTGITGIYDTINNTALFVVLQTIASKTATNPSNNYTLGFNEKKQAFESFYDYHPSIFINTNNKLLSFNNSNNGLYVHFTQDSEYNNFYGVVYPSEIVLQVRAESNDAVFNNITYRSEVTDSDGNDQYNKSLTHIKAWNEYQVSPLTALVYNKNISRKFRMWKASIPRQYIGNYPTLNRMRGQWMKLLLKFENPDNYKLVLHDTTIKYTSYPN